MLPVGLIGFMLPKKLEDGFYADPPKNKLDGEGSTASASRSGSNYKSFLKSELTNYLNSKNRVLGHHS